MTLDFRASQTRTNKIIASGSTGTNAKILLYPFASALDLAGTIDPAKFATGSIGKDIFFYVSGGIGSLDGGTYGAMVTGGDLHVSGNLRVQGSLLFSSGTHVEFGLSDYVATTNVGATVLGQHHFNPSDYTSFPIYVQGNLAISNPAGNISVRLYNVTLGQYVEIAGPGLQYLVASSSTPAFFSSVNLQGATGFSAGAAIYELHASVSNGSYTGYVGGWNLAVTGAGVQGPVGPQGPSGADGIFVTSGAYSKTSQSVVFGSGSGFVYPNAIGSDIFFFVSGSTTQKSVFGGDLVVSGNLTVKLTGAFSGPVTASAPALFSSTLTATNTASFSGPVTASNTSLFSGATSFSGTLTAVNTASFSGPVTASNTSLFSGVASFTAGLSGSLTRLTDGTSYLVAGQNITITSQSNGSILLATTTGSIFTQSGSQAYTTSSVAFDSSQRYPTQLASDVFFFVSGGNSRNARFDGNLMASGGLQLPYNTKLTSNNAAGTSTFSLVFGATATGIYNSPTNVAVLGDVSNVNAVAFAGSGVVLGFLQYPTGSFISGSMQFPQGISGSLTKLTDGTSYLRAGPGITINSSSNGAVTISGSVGTFGRLFVGRYTTTTNTSSNPQACGQNNWSPTEFGFISGSSSVFLQAILSAQTGSATAFVKLYNTVTGAYVDIGGTGVTTLSTSQATPTKLLSVNLANAANFVITAEKIYEVQIYTSVSSSTTFLGSAELLTQV